jgi:stage III sporulation protein SpoIIIAA
MDHVSDISLDLGRRPYCWHNYQRKYLCENTNDFVEDRDIHEIATSLHEFGDDNRAGIDGQLHRISCIRNNANKIIGLTIRVGRYIEGNSDMIRDLLEEKGKSILILGEVRALTLLGTVYCFCTHLMVYLETIAFCTIETAWFR